MTAAAELADLEGVAALTLRALAASMGVGVMSIYHHVRDKEDLLDALVDRVFEEIESPDPAAPDWRAELRRRSVSLHAVLVRHPWVTTLLESRTSSSRPATLAHHEAVLATLLGAGCGPSTAARAYVLLDAVVYGLALQQLTMPALDGTGPPGGESGTMATTSLPATRSVVEALVAGSGTDFASMLESMLDLALEGVEAWMAGDAGRETGQG